VSLSGEERKENLETIALAIEDMLNMGILKLTNAQDNQRAVFSVKFSSIVTNLIERQGISGTQPDSITTLMYHSLLIFMNEVLGIPKTFVIAIGNDIEKYKEKMECANIIFQYATILQKLFSEGKKEVHR
jgi:hypothetical protein